METNELDSWEVRIENFSKVIGKTIKETEEMLNDKMLGLTQNTPDVLYMLSNEEITPFGDLRHVFCNINGIPVPKLRMGIKFLRGDKDEREKAASTNIDPDSIDLQQKYGIEITPEDLSIEQLMGYYKPHKRNRISEVLKSKYEDVYGPFIAFKPGTDKVALDETINYVVDLEMGGDPQDAIEVDGELVKLYPVGGQPNKVVDEDPLYPGFKLNQGRSSKNRVSWKDVPLETRQFYRILFMRKEINREDRVNLSNILPKSLDNLKEIFPEAFMEFREKKSLGKLDSLKMIPNSSVNKRNNPFG